MGPGTHTNIDAGDDVYPFQDTNDDRDPDVDNLYYED